MTGSGVGRRGVLAGGAASAVFACLPAAAGATPARVNGAFGLRTTAEGPATLRFEEEGGGTIDPALAWHLGSNSKAMTALLYAVLVEEGVCRWGATLGELFPEIAVYPALASATVEELMAHAAGLTDEGITGFWLMARRMDRATPTEQRLAFTRERLARPTGGERGAFAYANANYIVLGAAIEQATGESWEEALRRRIFAPLGLESAGFGAPTQQALWGRQTFGKRVVPADPAGFADNPPVLGPAGTVHMAPADYGAFLALFLRTGAPLLAPANFRHLLTPPRRELFYAGGWALVGGQADGDRFLMHDGSNTMWYVRALVDRATGLAYAAGTNRGGDAALSAVERMIASLRAADA